MRGHGGGRSARSATRRAWAIALACALAASACRSSYYDAYRAEHPGFDASLPRVGATLPELLAALHAPERAETIDVALSRLAIFRIEDEQWHEIGFDSIRSGDFEPSDADDYVVLVGLSCRFEMGLNEKGSRRAGYYLLRGNRVAAYDHYTFRDRCAAGNEFVAARGSLVPAEGEAFARLAGLGAPIGLSQAYRRGLAYLEAGRVADARAMLVLGERSYRASAQALRAAGRGDALIEAEREREALMRALGVEPIDAQAP